MRINETKFKWYAVASHLTTTAGEPQRGVVGEANMDYYLLSQITVLLLHILSLLQYPVTTTPS